IRRPAQVGQNRGHDQRATQQRTENCPARGALKAKAHASIIRTLRQTPAFRTIGANLTPPHRPFRLSGDFCPACARGLVARRIRPYSKRPRVGWWPAAVRSLLTTFNLILPFVRHEPLGPFSTVLSPLRSPRPLAGREPNGV